MSDKPYNPLEMDNLGESIGRKMLASEPTPMPDMKPFQGVGVYAIYYTGDFPAYELLAERNRDGQFAAPIYVGKAIPSGGRKGLSLVSGKVGQNLYNRLNKHRQSLIAAENLDVADFHVRWLVVEPVWIPLGESLLIRRFQPVWNGFVDGFGSNDPGKGRHAGERPRWDTLHPGRKYAEPLAPRKETPDEIIRDVQEYLRARLQV